MTFPELSFDKETRAVYIKLADGYVDKTVVLENNGVYYADVDINGTVLGYELFIPQLPNRNENNNAGS